MNAQQVYKGRGDHGSAKFREIFIYTVHEKA